MSNLVLETNTDEGGRLSENVEIELYRSCEFEMVISTENYFKKKSRQMENNIRYCNPFQNGR